MASAHQQPLQLDERRQINARRADCHPGANHRIEHPTGDRYDDAGRPLHLKKSARRSLLHATHRPCAEIWVTPVMDFQLLPDMGRMNGRWPSAARTISSPAPTAAAARWAIVASLIETAKLNDVDPYAYLRDVLERMADGHPMNRLDDLLPWNWTQLKAAA